jgi:NADH:ubiquinone oxidoreductase subunit 5 (subunit L)/multisubunit Na+/H+ antiporter MnhA subunit
MYSLVVVLPILSSIISGLFGRLIGMQGSKVITTSLISITCVIA